MPWCSWLARDVPSRLDIQLVSVEDAFEAHRRFPRWLPGTVMGVGALAVVGGFLFVRSGQEKMNDYDQTIARECAVNGCDFTQLEQWRDLRDAVSMVDESPDAAPQGRPRRVNVRRDGRHALDVLIRHAMLPCMPTLIAVSALGRQQR